MQRLFGKALAAILALGLVAAATAGAANLITGQDILNGTVTGADLKQGTVKLGDLSSKAKTALAGVPGPAGPAGPVGPAGPAGTAGSADRYAEVTGTGTLVEDVKGIEQAQVVKGNYAITPGPDPGIYCFSFPEESRPVAGAANGLAADVIATLQIQAGGGIYGCPAAANVRVGTYDVSVAGAADRPFRLILENG
ncbi:MAG TPA: hypothetical protein VE526_05365 [Solirubrobacteraceae bacterium]|nr:hypothetical protein [Solirubrobacteraceae bacterium]